MQKFKLWLPDLRQERLPTTLMPLDINYPQKPYLYKTFDRLTGPYVFIITLLRCYECWTCNVWIRDLNRSWISERRNCIRVKTLIRNIGSLVKICNNSAFLLGEMGMGNGRNKMLFVTLFPITIFIHLYLYLYYPHFCLIFKNGRIFHLKWVKHQKWQKLVGGVKF